jgi:hypothetical protein
MFSRSSSHNKDQFDAQRASDSMHCDRIMGIELIKDETHVICKDMPRKSVEVPSHQNLGAPTNSAVPEVMFILWMKPELFMASLRFASHNQDQGQFCSVRHDRREKRETALYVAVHEPFDVFAAMLCNCSIRDQDEPPSWFVKVHDRRYTENLESQMQG